MHNNQLKRLPSNFSCRRVAVVIPSFRFAEQILRVLSEIQIEVWRIYVIDDACPENSGKLVETKVADTRVRARYLAENQGVGGATMAGYSAALIDGAEFNWT